MLRRESISGSLGGVAAPGGRAAGSENRAHRPLVPTGRDTRGARSLRFNSAQRDETSRSSGGATHHFDLAINPTRAKTLGISTCVYRKPYPDLSNDRIG
jgi:hypothetical protein